MGKFLHAFHLISRDRDWSFGNLEWSEWFLTGFILMISDEDRGRRTLADSAGYG